MTSFSAAPGESKPARSLRSKGLRSSTIYKNLFGPVPLSQQDGYLFWLHYIIYCISGLSKADMEICIGNSNQSAILSLKKNTDQYKHFHRKWPLNKLAELSLKVANLFTWKELPLNIRKKKLGLYLIHPFK